MSTQMQQLNDVQRLQAAGIPNVIAQAMSEDLRTLVVRSDMEALLQEGDIIVYMPQSWIEDSEVALMRLNSKLTLRRVSYCDGKARLQPLDLRIPASVADLDALNIKGRMVAVIRKVGE